MHIPDISLSHFLYPQFLFLYNCDPIRKFSYAIHFYPITSELAPMHPDLLSKIYMYGMRTFHFTKKKLLQRSLHCTALMTFRRSQLPQNLLCTNLESSRESLPIYVYLQKKKPPPHKMHDEHRNLKTPKVRGLIPLILDR